MMNNRATNITSVVTTIAKIADQTNLLSLNAAISAPRRSRRGFRSWRGKLPARGQNGGGDLDIERMVKEMQTAVVAGVTGMEKFSDEVRRAVQDVDQAGARFRASPSRQARRRASSRSPRAWICNPRVPARSVTR
jgi:methyl-accepting chemotaxis protein WspA